VSDRTAIAWTDHTFNPWMGCHKVSQGCKHCYAETLTTRRMGLDVWGLTGFRKHTSPPIWRRPLRWNRDAQEARTPARVFCASLADVFEDYLNPDGDGPNNWRDEVWALIRETPWIDWQLLTKRPENIARMLPDDWADNKFGCYPNVWLGTSIEDNRVVERAHDLVQVPAVVHFVSYEPAIGPVDELDLTGIEWLIAGGESGPGYRPMDLDWVRHVRHRCEVRDIAFFFKQSAAPRTEMGIELDGQIVRNYPRTWDRIGEARGFGDQLSLEVA
jgi:protein gp37